MKTATLAALGSGLVVRQTLAGESSLSNVYINKLGLGGKMKMSFFPYELKLKHVFTVATYSRTTTPDVQYNSGLFVYANLMSKLTFLL